MGHEKKRLRSKRHFATAILLIVLLVVGVRFVWKSQSEKGLLKVRFITDNSQVSYRLEVVNTPAGRQKGLMFRKSMPKEHGMLFIFPDNADHSFYMKNTFISLDMIFVSEDKKVVGVISDVPVLNETSRKIGKLSKYVIELNAGEAARSGIMEGTLVSFEGMLPAPL